MTSRAGGVMTFRTEAGKRLAAWSAGDEPVPPDDWLGAILDIETEAAQGVRDDIRARLGNPYEWNPGYCPWCDKTMLTEGHAADCLFAAISSSSATERCAFEACDLPTGHPGDHAFTPFIPGFRPSSATETQDGERPGLREGLIAFYESRKRARAALATPTPDDRDRIYPCGDPDCEQPKPHTIGPNWHGANTWTIAVPDDRDREVERIAAALRSVPVFRTFSAADHAAFLYDAGLRASGGD